ncbi:DUF4190 domain-containing protein [Streptomyces sp. NPDC091215]|uniref:DUF4190 domain-containing protein n=1 Tax=Streptomyces sp. NPDC091215 TaxID=3155192 RepID=UPI003432D054
MADEVPQAPKIRLEKGADAGPGGGLGDRPGDGPVGDGVADVPPPGWANPYAAPSGTPTAPPANPFAAPNRYAPPAPQQGAAVPPPPIAPDGPGQVPYGYPGAPAPVAPGPGYGYPGQPLPSYPGGPAGYGGWPGMQPMPNNGLGTASLVTGIISAIGFCLVPVSLVMGVLAIVFGSIGRARVRRGEATNGGQALAGIICGSAGLVISGGFVALLVLAARHGG